MDAVMMIGAQGRGPGRGKEAFDPGVSPAPGAVRDAAETRAEEIASDEEELPQAHENHGQDEKPELSRVHHIMTLQNLPNRPQRASRTSNLSEISAWWRMQM